MQAPRTGGYRGILQCDGYATYKQFAKPLPDCRSVTLVFCWSHVRRGSYDLPKGKAAPVATEALARIAALYRIEAGIRGKDAGHRLAVRQAESRTLVADLHTWLKAPRLPARGPTADAIRYALNHWDGLERFLEDGRVEMDSNSIERAMRPVALPQKRFVRRKRQAGNIMLPVVTSRLIGSGSATLAIRSVAKSSAQDGALRARVAPI